MAMLNMRIDSLICDPAPKGFSGTYLAVEDDISDSLIATFSAESYLICKVRHEVWLCFSR
jgi:hypothetical protein